MDGIEALKEARSLLENVTPLKTDCGRVCGGACCQCDEDGQGGMLLFPGEEKLYDDPLPAGFSLTESRELGVKYLLLTCEGRCDRKDRPLSCRLFPLLPTENGVILDRRGWAVCPLMEYGKQGLDPAFARAVQAAGQMLYACPEHAAFLNAIRAYNRQLSAL